MTTMFVGDVGTEIILDCGVDITTTTVRNIIARKPDGTKVVWTAAVEGTTAIKYIAQTGDLMAGKWAFQAYVEMPGWKGFGEVAYHTVSRPI